MKKLFVIIVMCCFMFTCASCKNDNIKFDVIEEKSSLISMADGSNINNILFDDNGLKIYKDYDEMVNDFNSNGVIIGDESFYEKYCVDFFGKKSQKNRRLARLALFTERAFYPGNRKEKAAYQQESMEE